MSGGIPVSGGTTGHGTLISTNLLYSPILSTTGGGFTRPAYTIDGTAGASGYDVAFAIDKDHKTLWKTAATSNDIEFTMIHGATPPTVYGVVVIGHNIASSAISLAKFEGGNDINYNTISADLTLNADLLTPAYHLLASPQAYDHWRIRVNFLVSTALQVGEIFLIGAPPLVFDRNYIYGFTRARELGNSVSSGIAGVPRCVTRWARTYMEFSFSHITETQLTALELAARNGHVVFSPSGSSGDALFGFFEIESAQNDFIDMYSVVCRFTEVAQ